MQIHAAILNAPHGRFIIETVRLDEPRADEVLVELTATGVCHSDIAIADQILPLPLPYVLGHEGAGVVREVGRAVTHVRKGDHVVLTFGSCGVCRMCLDSHPANCALQPHLNFSGRRGDGTSTIDSLDGKAINASFFGQSSFATHAISPARNVIKIRSDAPLEFLGPLGCGFMTGAGSILNVLKPNKDSTIGIVGIGAVGFAALFAANLIGCTRIVAIDRVKSRLELARSLGATECIDTTEVDLHRALMELGGADYLLDTTGVPRVIESALRALNIGGQFALAGASAEKSISLDIMHLMYSRVIRGIIEGDAQPSTFIPFLVEKFLDGDFPIDRIVEFFAFDDINEAIDACRSGATIKPILRF